MLIITTLNLKITYESTVGDVNATVTLYCDDKLQMSLTVPKHAAFDDMQEKVSEGWKQGA